MFVPYGATTWPARTGVESLMDEVLGDTWVHPRGQSLLLKAQVDVNQVTGEADPVVQLVDFALPERNR